MAGDILRKVRMGLAIIISFKAVCSIAILLVLNLLDIANIWDLSLGLKVGISIGHDSKHTAVYAGCLFTFASQVRIHLWILSILQPFQQCMPAR